MALGDHCLEVLHERVELGRGERGVSRINERRVEREHPQQGQRPEYDESVAVEILDQSE